MTNKTANLPKLPTDVKLIADRLLMGLEQFPWIPLHLALPYTVFKEPTAVIQLYINGKQPGSLAVKREYMALLDISTTNIHNPNSNIWNQLLFTVHALDDGESFRHSDALHTWLANLLEFQRQPLAPTLIERNPLLEKCCFTITPPDVIRDKKTCPTFVYSRYPAVTEPLKALVNYFSKTEDGIPRFLLYSYLNLFRDNCIVGFHPDQRNKPKLVVVYDNQTHALKVYRTPTSKKSKILTETDFLEILQEYEWSQLDCIFRIGKPEDIHSWVGLQL